MQIDEEPVLKGRKEFFVLGVFLFTFLVPLPGIAENGETLAVQMVDTPVKFRPADQTQWRDLSGTTAELPESGDFLVEEDGAVELRTEDSEINLNEKSGLNYRLTQDTADQLRLNHGSVKTEVNSGESEKETKLQLETPMGSLGIRGTEFGVSFEQSGRSEVYVDTGEVVLRTDRDRTQVADQEYVAFGQRGVEPTNKILDRGGLPDRYRVTWSRWSLHQQILRLERKRERILNRIDEQDNTSNEKDSSVQKELNNLENRLAELRDQYQPLNEEYESYRKRLEKKRGNFIRKRRQAFNEYRRRRMKQMREMRNEREGGIEEMRRQREEAISQ